MFSNLPSASQIFYEPDLYIGKRVTVSWDKSGTLLSVEQTNPYGQSKVRLVIKADYGGETFDVELDSTMAVEVSNPSL
ncbi:hypothetical protein SAMN05444374_1062 [Rhodococcoides kroppenstedtii]|uniref:Uncharacterized protein n=1 Tax=Rhodococcoides kroppenstedtii TaxID=293050 RepID=A0A1I0TEE8_9NOCA|nr:hypothetical protein [Rhodococcus kroppenstedtii]SFA50154.1 hypothetical protein SAMN05444374_1062 [Rhodococcus kroppenstedtii]